MATYNGISYSDMKNVSLKGTAGRGLGVIRWAPARLMDTGAAWTINPIAATDYGLYINASGNLVFSSLGATTVLGTGGSGGGVPSWNTIFAGAQTLSVQGTTFTITDTTAGANAILTVSDAAAASGALIALSQAGSGNDITGTSSSWTVSKAGAAAFLSVATATVNGAGAGITIGDSGANVVTIGTNSNTITLAKATTFSSTLAGVSSVFIPASNTVVGVLVTNNTITTFGHAVANGGVIVARSTSITTGTVIRAQTAEATLTTGFYFEAWDTTGSATVFSVAAKGATTIAGSAFGTAALTLTAGDLVISSGKINYTSADNTATSVAITDNTKAAHTLFALAGSGTFTGNTTVSFATITPSGLTSGTAIYVPLAAMNTGTGLNMVANAITTGKLVSLTHTTVVMTDGGTMLNISSTSVDTGGATTGTLVNLVSSGAQAATLFEMTDSAGITGTMMLLSNVLTQTTGHVLSLLSTGTITTTGDVLAVTANNATTSTGLVRVTANGLTTGTAMLVTSSGVIATTGNLVSLVASGLTTGTALNMGTLAALTTGVGIKIAHTTSVIADTGSLVRISSSSVDTGGATNGTLLDLGSTGATTGAILMKITDTALLTGSALAFAGSGVYTGTGYVTLTHNALTTGTAVLVTLNGLTTGKGISIAHTTAVIASGGSLLNLSSTSIDTGTTAGVLMNLSSTASAAGTQVLKTYSGLTTGIGDSIVAAALTSGTALSILGGGANQLSTAKMVQISSGASTDGTTLFVTQTGAYAGTVGVMTLTTGMTTGRGFVFNAAAITTGSLIYVAAGGTLTTGSLAVLGDNSADTSTRALLQVQNNNALATGCVPIKTTNTAVKNSKFTQIIQHTDGTKTFTLWLSQDQTSPNTVLSGTTGDVCVNGPSSRTFYCTGTTNWTASNA